MKKSDLIKACEEHEQISEIKNIVMFSDFGITHNTAKQLYDMGLLDKKDMNHSE